MTGAAGPALDLAPPQQPVRGVALVLHGGRETSTEPVAARQLAVLRMLPFARSLAVAGARHGLAVARLRYRVRGWNGDLRSPVADTADALDQLARRFPGAPIALVGHSMGGRTALHVAGDPAVRTVVALAPWVTAADPVATMGGRRLFVVHGEADRITDPSASCRYARAAATLAESASWLGIRRERHAMLRRPALWHELATGYVLGALLGVPCVGTVRKRSAKLVTMALAGEPRIIV